MDCSAYLHRIGFEGQPSADFATLRCVQRLHLRRIPFENLDVQLGRRVTLDRAHAFAKLVNDHRGGWCFEMNSVFGWALECIGFSVMPMTGAVRRYEGGPDPVGNHLVLCVDLDKPYLVDVGLGDGPAEPIPLEQGVCRQPGRVLRLEQLGKGWWRLHDAGNSPVSSLDFLHQPADWELLRRQCHWLQSSPQSRFVQNAICLRHTEKGIVALVGRVLKTVHRDGTTERLLSTATEYVDTLRTTFDIRLPEATCLWPAISRRHGEVFESPHCEQFARAATDT